jgi:hypothetical protein
MGSSALALPAPAPVGPDENVGPVAAWPPQTSASSCSRNPFEGMAPSPTTVRLWCRGHHGTCTRGHHARCGREPETDIRSRENGHPTNRNIHAIRRISRDARGQRLSRSATGVPERERPGRRLGAQGRSDATVTHGRPYQPSHWRSPMPTANPVRCGCLKAAVGRQALRCCEQTIWLPLVDPPDLARARCGWMSVLTNSSVSGITVQADEPRHLRSGLPGMCRPLLTFPTGGCGAGQA